MMIITLCLLLLLTIASVPAQAMGPPPPNDNLCKDSILMPRGDCTDRSSSLSGSRKTDTLVLFPDLQLKRDCEGTVVRLGLVGWRNMNGNGNETIKLQFWRLENKTRMRFGDYRRVGHKIISLKTLIDQDLCDTRPTGSSAVSGNFAGTAERPTVVNCSLPLGMNVLVQTGDVLGIVIPRNETESEVDLCLTEVRPKDREVLLCICTFDSDVSQNNRITLNMPPNSNNPAQNRSDDPSSESDCNCIRQQKLPQIRIYYTIKVGDTDSTTTSTPEETTDSTGLEKYLAPVVVVLLIVIIVLITIGIIRFYCQRKRSLTLTTSNDAYPNPVYHANNHQGGKQSASITNADYDEISDESPTKKKVPTESETALERSTQGNNYFTLTPTQEEDEKDGQTQTVAANYEVFIPTQDHSGESFDEKPSAMFDMDDTYWEPADSINELYKQLSSDKYRDISPQHVDLSEVLGSGEFGTVNKGTWQSPVGAMEVAVKQLQPGASEEEKVKFLQEAAINGQFRHPNVVKLMGVVTTGETTMIVLELLSHGDLRSFLLKLRQGSVEVPTVSVDQQCLLKFCQQIASGMEYLSNKAFVHRDLAARNILVSGDQVCKISDFGMSRNLMDEDYYVSHGGRIPVKWTAPEAINYKKYSSASDVWSFGCVMYEIWSLGHKPFESHSNPEVIKIVDKGYRLPPPPGLSKELYKIMMQCWQPKTSHRPTFTQLVEMLSRADFELFVWKEEDLKDTHPQVKDIGAPLEVAENIYLDIQNMYK